MISKMGGGVKKKTLWVLVAIIYFPAWKIDKSLVERFMYVTTLRA